MFDQNTFHPPNIWLEIVGSWTSRLAINQQIFMCCILMWLWYKSPFQRRQIRVLFVTHVLHTGIYTCSFFFQLYSPNDKTHCEEGNNDSGPSNQRWKINKFSVNYKWKIPDYPIDLVEIFLLQLHLLPYCFHSHVIISI